jgi:chromate reductase, NAD(P)H dehydrogenase (quinone)
VSTGLRVLGICGSLRKKSFNLWALHAAAELAPPGVDIVVTSYADIPMFNQDDFEQAIPDSVVRLRTEIEEADGVLIASPEYNHSMTGVLKNAIDWLSRPPNPFAFKPVAIVSAATSPLGGARVQYDVRRVLQPLDALVLSMPETFIGSAKVKFDAEGRLTDAAARESLTKQLLAFQKWMLRFKVEAPV